MTELARSPFNAATPGHYGDERKRGAEVTESAVRWNSPGQRAGEFHGLRRSGGALTNTGRYRLVPSRDNAPAALFPATRHVPWVQ
jgi:hypothetical protein